MKYSIVVASYVMYIFDTEWCIGIFVAMLCDTNEENLFLSPITLLVSTEHFQKYCFYWSDFSEHASDVCIYNVLLKLLYLSHVGMPFSDQSEHLSHVGLQFSDQSEHLPHWDLSCSDQSEYLSHRVYLTLTNQNTVQISSIVL